MTGIEPVDLFLTKEALYRLSYMGSNQPGRPAARQRGGAGDEIRTRDIQLGRLELYQLSYTRVCTLAVSSAPANPRGLPDPERGSSTHAGSPVVTIDLELGSRNLLHKTLLRMVVGGGFEPP